MAGGETGTEGQASRRAGRKTGTEMYIDFSQHSCSYHCQLVVCYRAFFARLARKKGQCHNDEFMSKHYHLNNAMAIIVFFSVLGSRLDFLEKFTCHHQTAVRDKVPARCPSSGQYDAVLVN